MVNVNILASTHDGASAKFSTNLHESDYSAYSKNDEPKRHLVPLVDKIEARHWTI
jgi:hypothetical protein